MSGRLSLNDYLPSIEKITTRIGSWEVKCFSLAGRLQLVRFVLLSIPNFLCTHFILPKKVIKIVENRCSAFLWPEKADYTNIVKVKWDTDCLPRIEGLGLRWVKDRNKTCIVRLIWLIFDGIYSLWIAWVYKHLLKDKSFWAVTIKARISWTLRKALKFRNTGRQLIKFVVGNGHKIYLWLDNWHPKGPLLNAYRLREVYDAAIHINAKLSSVIHSGKWLVLARNKSSEEPVEIQSLPVNIQSNSENDDIAIWIPSKSLIYHTTTTWNWIRVPLPKVPWYVWCGSKNLPRTFFHCLVKNL